MTLKALTNALGEVARQQPAVGTVVESDVRRLNGLPDAKYGVFVWTQQTHSVDTLSGIATFNFWLFYIDRVDTGDKTETDAQSDGVDVLTNIIRTVATRYELDLSGDVQFHPFTGFKDDCAGMYCEVGFQTDIVDGCEDEFDNVND